MAAPPDQSESPPDQSESQGDSPGPPKAPPKAKRQLPGGLTGNALVSGIVSAIVAGVISLVIAHNQDQDAARQAVADQQTSAAVQLQTAANVYYEAAFALWGNCEQNLYVACNNGTAAGSPFAVAQTAFNADLANVSDPRASALAAQLVNLIGTAIDMSGSEHPGMYMTPVVAVYQELIIRCGQLIRGQ